MQPYLHTTAHVYGDLYLLSLCIFFQDCEDNHVSCEAWASQGECEKNPDYMLANCKKSCDVSQDINKSDTVDCTSKN